MRMGLNDFSAEDVINKLETKELEKILNFLVMKKMQKISIKITKERKIKKIDTKSLVKIIESTKKEKF